MFPSRWTGLQQTARGIAIGPGRAVTRAARTPRLRPMCLWTCRGYVHLSSRRSVCAAAVEMPAPTCRTCAIGSCPAYVAALGARCRRATWTPPRARSCAAMRHAPALDVTRHARAASQAAHSRDEDGHAARHHDAHGTRTSAKAAVTSAEANAPSSEAERSFQRAEVYQGRSVPTSQVKSWSSVTTHQQRRSLALCGYTGMPAFCVAAVPETRDAERIAQRAHVSSAPRGVRPAQPSPAGGFALRPARRARCGVWSLETARRLSTDVRKLRTTDHPIERGHGPIGNDRAARPGRAGTRSGCSPNLVQPLSYRTVPSKMRGMRERIRACRPGRGGPPPPAVSVTLRRTA